VLTAAHVFDDRPEASQLLNLAALCQKCHNGHDAEGRRRRRRERLDAVNGQAMLF
jgi:5-methylcytosine-specific restriction endonuclease McrA